jgi:hypothetical protein
MTSKLKVDFIDNSSSQYDENAALIQYPRNAISGQGKLYIGDQYALSYVQLKFRKVKAVVCCSSDLFGHCKESNIEYLKFDPDEKKLQSFDEVANFISKNVDKHLNVVVVCESGFGKSATIVFHYLMKRYKIPLSDCYNLVRDGRGKVRMTASLCKLVVQMEKSLLDSNTMQSDGNNLIMKGNSSKVQYPSNSGSSRSSNKSSQSQNSSSNGLVVLGVIVGCISVLYCVLYAITGKR